ncbi:MAG: carboxypeptidase-like regulatory domain-containing protein [Archangium sp.]
MTRILSACMVLALAACAPKEDANGDGIADGIRDPNSVSQVAPSNPIGTVSGTVVNASGLPIDGVEVKLVLGNGEGSTFTANSNSQGAYSFGGVPAGSQGQLFFTKTGFASGRTYLTVPSSAGNFPINDGNANGGTTILFQLTSTLKFQVFNAAGRAARGAKVNVEVSNSSFNVNGNNSGTDPRPNGSYSTSGEVDEAGLLTISNLPDFGELARINQTSGYSSSYVVSIGAVDDDNDGFVDWNGSVTSYTANQLFVNPNRTIFLARSGTQTPINIVATNVESLTSNGSPPYRNAVKGSDPITVVFNQPISQNDTTRLVKVVLEDCKSNVAASVTQRTPNSLSITPSMPWTLGARYNIIVRVTGLESGTTEEFIGYFFAMDPGSPRAVSNAARFEVRKTTGNMMNNALQPGDLLYVVFDAPVTNQGANVAVAQINLDVTNDGMVGGMTGVGEFNGPENTGFSITSAEQLQAVPATDGTFSCKASGYSSRWQVNITQFPTSQTIPSGTAMKVVFPKANNSAATYQSISGSPVQVDPAGTITIITP